nr:U18_MYRTX_Mru1a [Myrmica ruginodis]
MKNNRTNTFIIYLMVTFSLISIISITECTPQSHFQPCPSSHEHFCLNGECFYLAAENEIGCICPPGFQGQRCGELILD